MKILTLLSEFISHNIEAFNHPDRTYASRRSCHQTWHPALEQTLSNTRSEESFHFIQSYLDACSSTPDCGSLSGRPASQPRPGRLIQITTPSGHSPLNGDNVTLQLVNSNEVCQKYMALSHCLGVLPEDSLTMKSNLSHRQSSISFKELTSTFLDAVQITSPLGIRYLWIDPICII